MCSLPLHSSVCCDWSLSAFFSFQRLSTPYFQLPEGPVPPPVCMNSGSCCMYRELSRLSGRKPFFVKSFQCSSWEAGSNVSVAHLVSPSCNNVVHYGSEFTDCSALWSPYSDRVQAHKRTLTRIYKVFSTPQSTSAMVVWQNCLSLHLIYLSCCKK